MSSVDLYATALAIGGAKADADSDGVDLLPFLKGEKQGRPREVLYWRQGNKTALRVVDWKLVRHGRNQPGPWELYNLREDISESRNLAAGQPGRLAELRAAWEKLDGEMAEPAFR